MVKDYFEKTTRAITFSVWLPDLDLSGITQNELQN